MSSLGYCVRFILVESQKLATLILNGGVLTFVLDPHSRSKGLNLWGYYNLCFRRLNNDDSTIYVFVSTRATADLC